MNDSRNIEDVERWAAVYAAAGLHPEIMVGTGGGWYSGDESPDEAATIERYAASRKGVYRITFACSREHKIALAALCGIDRRLINGVMPTEAQWAELPEKLRVAIASPATKCRLSGAWTISTPWAMAEEAEREAKEEAEFAALLARPDLAAWVSRGCGDFERRLLEAGDQKHLIGMVARQDQHAANLMAKKPKRMEIVKRLLLQLA